MENGAGKIYKVWPKTTRFFHWVNVFTLFALLVVGLIIYNGGAFKFGVEARIMLKTVHVMIGYIFVLNLILRLAFGFIGNKHARFSAFLPFQKGFITCLKDYWAAYSTPKPIQYLGHNPMGRLAITAMFILLILQAVSGIVLAGTDIFFPPFGNYFAEMVAASGVNPADVVPYNKELVDPEMVKEMRAIRSPFIEIHKFGLYALPTLIVIHVASVIATEVKHGGGIISAMFTGNKSFKDDPVDKD